jgi:hypothetical protein
MGVVRLDLMRFLRIATLLTITASAFPSFASSQIDSVSGNRNWEITVDGGRLLFPRGWGAVTGWAQRYSIRAGLGTEILNSLWCHAFVEYQRYNSGLRWGDRSALLFERDYPRSDVAFYVSLTLLRYLQVGIGGVAQFHEDMLYHWYTFYSGHDSTRHILQAPSGLKLFLLTGLKYDIPLGAEFYLPVGLFVDSFPPLNPAGRLGISKRF